MEKGDTKGRQKINKNSILENKSILSFSSLLWSLLKYCHQHLITACVKLAQFTYINPKFSYIPLSFKHKNKSFSPNY